MPFAGEYPTEGSIEHREWMTKDYEYPTELKKEAVDRELKRLERELEIKGFWVTPREECNVR